MPTEPSGPRVLFNTLLAAVAGPGHRGRDRWPSWPPSDVIRPARRTCLPGEHRSGEPYQETRVARFGRGRNGRREPLRGGAADGWRRPGPGRTPVSHRRQRTTGRRSPSPRRRHPSGWWLDCRLRPRPVILLDALSPTVFQPFYVVAVILGATSLGSACCACPATARPLTVSPAVVLAMGYGSLHRRRRRARSISGYSIAWGHRPPGSRLCRCPTGSGSSWSRSYQFRSVPGSCPIIAIALLGASMAAVLALMEVWKVGPLASLGGLLPVVIGGPCERRLLERQTTWVSWRSREPYSPIGCMSVAQPRYRPLRGPGPCPSRRRRRS